MGLTFSFYTRSNIQNGRLFRPASDPDRFLAKPIARALDSRIIYAGKDFNP